MRFPTLSQLLRGLVVVLAVVLVTPAALMYWALDPHGWRRQSDVKLLAEFRAHRATFETLAAMASKDGVAFYPFGQNNLNERGISAARRTQYKALRAELGNPEMSGGPYEARFDFSSGGLLTISQEWSKGIAYLPEGPGNYPVMKSLDHIGMQTYGSFVVPIEGPWYLIFENFDG